MKKIASERNYRLVKEAVKVNGMDLVTSEELNGIKKNQAAYQAQIVKNHTNIKALWAKLFPNDNMA